jgi:hypothetical protein
MDLINVRSSSGKPPLCPGDVVPGTIFRLRRDPETVLWPMWVSKWGVQLGDGTTHDWAALQCHYEVLFPDSNDWQSCEEQWP